MAGYLGVGVLGVGGGVGGQGVQLRLQPGQGGGHEGTRGIVEAMGRIRSSAGSGTIGPHQ